MCLECGKKAVEIDNKVPHFIDRYHGRWELMPDSVYVPARKELRDFMLAKHGKWVSI